MTLNRKDFLKPNTRKVILVIVLLFVFVFLYGFSATIIPILTGEENSKQGAVDDYLTIESCEALALKSVLPLLMRDRCYKDYALHRKDFRFCKKHSKPSYCYWQVGESLLNLSICDMADGEHKARCYVTIAISTDNSALCGEVEDFKGAFKGLGTRRYCEEEILLKSGDPASCGQLSDESWRNECYFKFAMDRMNSTFCEKAGSSADNCYYNLAIKLNDPSICDMTVGENKAKCYGTIAIRTNNITLCGEIEEGFKGYGNKIYCEEKILINSGDPASCEKLVDEWMRNKCYYKIAIDKLNSTFCEKAGSSDKSNSYESSCYYDLAMKLNDPSICAMLEEKSEIHVTTELFTSACFFKLALKLKDISLCENVNDVLISEEGCSGNGAGYPRTCSTNNWTLNKSMCIDEIEGRHHHIDCPRGGAFYYPCLYTLLVEKSR
ncbi:MAG: hypothetical protein KAU95_04475 [Candidatus Aenigmarchaeota archaeon]|nr:hypothetical protein [Candidatus Aenigmarchaeota archaeon]